MKNQAAIFTILAITFTEVLGWSLILPFLPYLATDLGASPLIVGLIAASFSFFQFFSAPVFGKLSDKFGRKPMLVISQTSTVMGFVILGFANSLLLLFLSRIVDGLLGSNMTLSRAYLGDLVEGKDQTKVFGYMGAVFGTGFFIGPALGGILAANFGYSVPAFLAAGISFFTIILTLLTLEETVVNSEEERVEFKVNDFFPVRDLVESFKDPDYTFIYSVFFLFILSFTIITSSLSLYAEFNLNVGPDVAGLYLMFVGLVRIIFTSTVFNKLVNSYSRMFLMFIGFSSLLTAFIGIAINTNPWYHFLIMGLFSIGAGLVRPAITSEISGKSGLRTRGKYMGIADSLQSVTQIFSPILGGFVIETIYPGCLGVVSSIIVLPAILLVAVHVKRNGTARELDGSPQPVTPVEV